MGRYLEKYLKIVYENGVYSFVINSSGVETKYNSIEEVKSNLNAYFSDENIHLLVDCYDKNIEYIKPKIIEVLNYLQQYNYKVFLNALVGSRISGEHNSKVIDYLSQNKDKINNKNEILFRYYPLESEYYPLSEYIVVEEQLELCASDIKDKELSPLERALAAFYVSTELFSYGKKSSNRKKSFSIYTSLIDHDSDIFCQSYSYLFKKLCDNVDVECASRRTEAVGPHAINVLKINDDKYKVNGEYLVDPTRCSELKNLFRLDPDEFDSHLEESGLKAVQFSFGLGKDKSSVEKYKKLWSGKVDEEEYSFLRISNEGIDEDIIKEAYCYMLSQFVKSNVK